MRDIRFKAVHRGGLLDVKRHRLLAAWAADCAEHVLPLFTREYPRDDRPRRAIEAARSWSRGEITAGAARAAAIAAHAAARDSAEDAARAVARAAGHAAATAHMGDHARGPALYAVKAVQASGKADGARAADRERAWQRAHLPKEIRTLILRRVEPCGRKRPGVLAALGIAVVSAAVLTNLACRKERTYTSEVRDGVRYVHNLKPASEKPVAGLAFVQQIGELEAKDPDYQFTRPISVAEDARGNLFVLDDKDGCIKKYGPDRKFLLKFGRKGQGPGEMAYPMSVAVAANGLVVVATMSSDFHVFDNDGVYKERFRLPPYRGISPTVLGSDRIVAYAFQTGGENSRDNHVLAVFDFQGKVRYEFGEPYLLDTARKTWNANFLQLAVDADENIYVAFSTLNRIEKYSPQGQLILSIDRALPFEIAHRYGKSSMEIGGKAVSIDEPDFTPVNRGIGIDSQGRIWVLSVRKAISRSQMPKEYNIGDYLAFEIYSPDGVLLSRIPFPQEIAKFDTMIMHGDHLFFIDPFDQACVYEYAVVDKND